MNADKATWIRTTADAAAQANHVWPMIAACEAALESNFGSSKLAHDANNLFGMKQHVHPVYGTLSIPTKEYVGGEWEVVDASWVKYPTLADCFTDRMDTLERLSVVLLNGVLKYPHYDAALHATDAVTYVSEISKTWSTDPLRADKVTAIYHDFLGAKSDTDEAEFGQGG